MKWRERKTGRKREENKILYLTEGEGDEYMSEGEDGRPCIKCRKKLSTKPIGEKSEIVEKIKEVETEAKEKLDNPRDA